MPALFFPKFVIENMTQVWGPGWWDDTPWRFVSTDAVHIGNPHATKEDAEKDLAQYVRQLETQS